jgi:hypothetical protein
LAEITLTFATPAVDGTRQVNRAAMVRADSEGDVITGETIALP